MSVHTHSDTAHSDTAHSDQAHSDHTNSDHAVAAWAGSVPITVADVARRERALRDGEFASRLPVRRTPQGRNVLRWIVQLIATEQLIDTEARARELRPGRHPGPRQLDVSRALELGGVLATVLASMPVAPAVRDAVTSGVQITLESARHYYDLNLDQFQTPESRVIDVSRAGGPASRFTVLRGELPASWERLVFAAKPGSPVAVTAGQVITTARIHPARTESFSAARSRIETDLREHERDRQFADWVHCSHRKLVRLAPGYEHPGDPHHPDAIHHH